MTEHDRKQTDEQVYQQSKNKSDELPQDPTPEYDEAVEESFPASDPPSTTASVPDAPTTGTDRS
ncbi:MAG TPA: hypothetical protein VFZ66_13155 [Herpetosiphonaceae bacterium]